jgi:acyl-[acyl-carrier-protein]-phospholipid O-acyltransferase/long-chain-fatty-acid--[acyl-carrier-protein] ligase
MNSRGYVSLLQLRGFRSLLATQFLGALNDNMMRIIASLYILSPAVETHAPATWIVLGGIAFIAPCLLFAGPAGRLSDRCPKRRVIIGAKFAELLVVILAAAALIMGSLPMTVAVLFLMSTQSAFFSPARYSILPELFPRSDLARVNGLGEMSIFAAVILGMCGGAAIFDIADGNAAMIASPMILAALAGIASSFFVPRSHIAPAQAGPIASAIQSGRHFHKYIRLVSHRKRALVAAVAGTSAFWCIGSIIQIDILFIARDLLELSDTGIGLLQGTLGLGVGAGGLVAGRLVHRHSILRLMQAGMFSLVAGLFALVLNATGPVASFSAMFFAGVGGGLFLIPIIAFMQAKCDLSRSGRLFAVNNFMNMAGALIGIGLFWLIYTAGGLSPDRVMLVLAVVTAAALLAVSLSSLWRVACAHQDDSRRGAVLLGGTR